MYSIGSAVCDTRGPLSTTHELMPDIQAGVSIWGGDKSYRPTIIIVFGRKERTGPRISKPSPPCISSSLYIIYTSSGRLRKGSGKAKEGQWQLPTSSGRSRKGSGKATEGQWEVKEGQWQVKKRQWKGQGKAVERSRQWLAPCCLVLGDRDYVLAASRRRDGHSAAPPSTFIRCFHRDEKGVPVK